MSTLSNLIALIKGGSKAGAALKAIENAPAAAVPTKSWRTTACGICTILVGVGAAGKAWLDGDAATAVNWEATLAAIVAGVGLIKAHDAAAAIKAVASKPADSGDGGYARVSVLCAVVLLWAIALGLAGCASNRTVFRETLYDPATGNRTSHTVITAYNGATTGAKLQEGAGNVTYTSTGAEPWALDVGATAKGLEAEGVSEALKATAGALQAIAPIAQAAIQAKATAVPNAITATGTAVSGVIGAARQPVTTTDTAEGGAK